MLYNYLKIAIRSILKHRLFSFINIFGLSFSIATGMIIIMLMADQYSYDAFNTEADRIYRINHQRSDMDNLIAGMATSPMPLGDALASQYPGIESYTRLYRGFGNGWIKLMQDVNIPISGFYADPNVLELFQYELALGDPTTALVDPYSVVLTQETAEKLFKKDNPIGEILTVGKLGGYKVTGVLKPLDGKSHIKFDGLASLSTVSNLVKQGLLESSLDNWLDRSRGWTYIKLLPGTEVATVESYLSEISHAQYDQIDNMDARFFLQNIRAINPGPLMGNQIGPGMPVIMLYFLIGLGLVIVVSSCFNYTNLSVARSLSRAREVGVRKIFGAVRRQVFGQFLLESMMIALLAYLLALVLVYFLRPIFLSLNFSQLLDFDLLQSTEIYLICLGFAGLVGLLAGVLPAWIQSSVQALQALKSMEGLKLFKKLGFRKFLVVIQFGLSLLLVMTVWLIYNQMDYMTQKEYGFNADNNVVIQLYESPRERLMTELNQYSSLLSVSAAGFTPASGTSSTEQVIIQEEERPINVHYVDEHYLDNMELRLLAGRNFSGSGDTHQVLINEQAVASLGYASIHEAIGQGLELRDDSISFQVIGVIGDYHHETLFSEIKPLMLQYNSDRFDILQVKVNSANYETAIRDIEQAWAAINPNLQIEYKLLADEIAFFADLMFGDISKIIAFISFLAILISSLGLMGMVLFSTQSRSKEISIRKVLGAPSQVLVLLLSSSFLKLMGVAIGVALPLGWWINELWLSNIAYRVPIGLEVLVGSILMVSMMALVVIGTLTWKTASANPTAVLRDE